MNGQQPAPGEVDRIEALPIEERAAAYVALADSLQRRLESRD